MSGDSGSRAATDELLAGLRDGRWRPGAWRGFLRAATERSVHQASRRPRALAEITALHIAFAALAGPGARGWPLTSWALAVTHLGMLEDRESLAVADVVTLARANLPVLSAARWLPVLALASDVADGRLARARGTVSPFGAAADSLADAAFWFWFALRHEPSGRMRTAALLAWVLPVVAVVAASVRRGRMVDAPRPVVLRPAAALQAVLTLRALARLRRPS